MSEIKEQDRKKDEEGQVAIKRLSKPIKGRILLAQIFTFFFCVIVFRPIFSFSVVRGYFFIGANHRRTD